MFHGDDFIVTVHALERFELRFPKEYNGTEEVGLLIYEETMDALENNRTSFVPPVEFANNDLDRWEAGKSQIVWTSGKARGYVLVEGTDGLTVATVLVGRPSEAARKRLYGTKTKGRPLTERDAYGYRINPEAPTKAGVEEASAEVDT